jgi:uncharacterized repeat protein (TIGR01451 family)
VIGLDKKVYVVNGRSLYCLNPVDGNIEWEHKVRDLFGGMGFGAAPSIDSHGTLYIPGDCTFAIDKSGKLLWEWNGVRTPDIPYPYFKSTFDSPIAIADGRLYVIEEVYVIIGMIIVPWGWYLNAIESLPLPIKIEITPDPLVTKIKRSSYPCAKVYDGEGKPIPDETLLWWRADTGHLQGINFAITLPLSKITGGSSTIYYSTGYKPCTGSITAHLWRSDLFFGSASLNILLDEKCFESIDVIPHSIKIPLGESCSFSAIGWDRYENKWFDDFSWKTIGPIGRIDKESGSITTLTAADFPTIGRLIASCNGITGYADVKIGEGPIISVEPGSGKVGSIITVYGGGFPANETITIGFDYEESIATATTDNDGFFLQSFKVSEQTGGRKTITAKGGLIQATSTFLLLPSISKVYPSTPLIGINLTVEGEGFFKEEPIRIDLGTNLSIATATTNSKGWFSAQFTVATQPYATVVITAEGLVSRIMATSSFILKKAYLFSGWIKSINGTGIPSVQVFLSGQIIRTVMTNSGGYYGFLLPEDHWLRVTPLKTNWIFEPSFRIEEKLSKDMSNQNFVGWQKEKQAIVISPVYGEVGDLVTVRGGVYQAGKPIRIDFGTQATITTTTADSQGLFSLYFKLPIQPSGTKVITAFGISSSQTATCLFFLQEPLPKITLQKSLNKAKVTKGGTLTYTIIYTNEGNGTATDVNIIEVLPENVKLSIVHSQQSIVNYYVNGSWQEIFSELATKIKWLIPQVAPASSGTVSFTVRLE